MKYRYKKVQEYVIHDDFFFKKAWSFQSSFIVQKVSIKSRENLEK